MRAIFGLGNPGSEYEHTRHNIGFDVVDAVALKLNVRFKPGRGEFLQAQTDISGQILLVKPMTCMNNSGITVEEIVRDYDLSLQDTLTIADDFEIPLGIVRFRKKGGSGGHNGLASLIWALQSDEFPRLRCGIGNDTRPRDKRLTAGFVLSTFEPSELQPVKAMIQRAADVATAFVQGSVQNATDLLSKQ